MYILRSIEKKDLNKLFELSKLQNFINLPNDKHLLEEKIDISIKSFKNPSQHLERNYYIFVLEDTLTKELIGTSMIHGKHGTTDIPHFYLKVGHEKKFSQTLNTGFIHGTLKFGYETDGYSEIGGLILDPKFRGNTNKLGKALSFVRFLFIARNKERFTDQLHVELMPPVDSEGKSPLWEAIGRRFLNMDYDEADKLSQDNKEFILTLFPQDTIYQTLLPVSAKDAIGKIHKNTKPVLTMLKSIGFKYTDEVDPFDGGPHYRAKTKEITPVKNTKKYKLNFTEHFIDSNFNLMLIEKNSNHFETYFAKAIVKDSELYLLKEDLQYFNNQEYAYATSIN